MTKLSLASCMTAAVTVGGVLIWEAQATPLTGVTSSFAVIKSYSTVQKVGCIFRTSSLSGGYQNVLVLKYGSTGKTCVCRPCQQEGHGKCDVNLELRLRCPLCANSGHSVGNRNPRRFRPQNPLWSFSAVTYGPPVVSCESIALLWGST